MEFQGNAGFLSSMPPKLEDAGLEDCALPIEGIQVYWHPQFGRAALSFYVVCYLHGITLEQAGSFSSDLYLCCSIL